MPSLLTWTPVTAVMAAVLFLAGCQPREDPALRPGEPVDPDTIAAERETPLGLAAPAGEDAGRLAVARLHAVAGSGVTGQVRFEESGRGVVVIAEVGGLPEGTHDLRILDRTACRDLGDADPFDPTGVADGQRPSGSLDAIDVADDGTGRYETLHPNLQLTGRHSIVGRAVVALEAGHHHAADPGDRVVACGVIGPAVG